MAAPQALLDLLNSLHLDVTPTNAAPGDQISPRVLPDVAPLPGGLPNPLLNALAQGKTLAQIDADLAPILSYLANTFGIDSAAVQKAVEFAKPVDTTAGLINVSSPNQGDLRHLIPDAAGVLGVSPNVEGLIGRALSTFTFKPDDFVSTVTATITQPAVVTAPPTVTLAFRVQDEAGTPLVAGTDFFTSGDPFAPTFVLMPAVFDTVGNPPASVRRNFLCDVSINFTPVTPPGAPAETVTRTLGPVAIDFVTTLVPLVAVLTEHAVGDPRFPGAVFMGVPQNSSVGSVGDAFAALGQIRTALSNITTVLGLLGIAVPSTLAAAISALNIATGLAPGHFEKSDLTTFFWVGFFYWDDWQGIFSAVFLFGPPMRRIFLGHPLPFEGFSVFPAALGVAAIPDLSIFPLSATVGTARQDSPPPPTPPSTGTYNDMVTSINFPVP